MKTSRVTITTLAVLLLGCAGLAATYGVRVGASFLSRKPQPVASGRIAGSTGADAPTRGRAQALLGKLPLAFIENRGQEDPQVAYYVQGRDTAVYFTSTGLTLALTGPKGDGAATDQPSRRLPVRRVSTAPARPARERWAVRLDFVGAQPVIPRGEEPKSAVVSYFKGDDASTTALKTYGSVVYPELWPGIDLVYTGDAGRLKYTFLVKPGADPAQIRLAYRGTSAVTLTDAGQLHIATPVGALSDDRPYAYQEGNGQRDEVAATYALAAATSDGARGYGFKLGRYDRTRPLVLDPSLLVYAGYIGGAGNDEARGIAVDAAGNAYVVGTTSSAVPSFPAKVGPDLIFSGGFSDVFVAKIKADGTDLVYLGYLGGAGQDEGTAIAVDKAGNAYVTGFTKSDQTTFPVTVGPSQIHGGRSDAFVAKVRADGTGLVYCGYIGGAGFEGGSGIAVDAAGNAYVAGSTDSDEQSFPVKIGPDLVYGGGFDDAFVAKVKADGTALVYAGYIGGAGDDIANAIAVDAGGNAYVTGFTDSDQTSFPANVGPDLNFNGGDSDAFVAKVKADGTTLLYAGYIGGAGSDSGKGIAVDATGSAYVTGVTGSDQTTFPVRVGPDLVFNGGPADAFVAKVKADGSGLVYAGYIGGAGDEFAAAIAIDTAGNAYVTGATASNQDTFPVKQGPDVTFNGDFDAFVAKVRADGRGLVYAGYLGGADFDRGEAIAVDITGNVYIAGRTASDQATFPVTAGPDLIHGGNDDAFVVKISGKPDLTEGGEAVAASPSVVKPGGMLTAADGAINVALGPSKTSTTRYYLSTDAVRSANDILLIGSRVVPPLETATSHFGSATLTVPANTPTGTYRVLACADDSKTNTEIDETNNCSAGTTIAVALPDLAAVGVSNPPQTAKAGSQFLVFDNSVNLGQVGASASTTRFYLSKDGSKGTGDVLLTTARSVPALNASGQVGDLSSGSTVVTIPAGLAAGVYRVLACADDTNVVKETIESNNCVASFATMQVTK